MKVAIVGSRGFPNDDAIRNRMEDFPPDTEYVSGGAAGVDSYCRELALRWHRKYTEFPADWQPGDRRAGARRNQQIVDYADRVIAFWDGVSPGTKITIDMALRAHKHLEVIFP